MRSSSSRPRPRRPRCSRRRRAVLPKDVPLIVVGGVTARHDARRGSMPAPTASGSARASTSRASRRPRPRDKARAYVAGLDALMRPLRIAIIGFGKIAADQHVPAIAGQSALRAGRDARAARAPGRRRSFTDWRELLDEVEGLEAVAITTPPRPRYEIARECIERGLHVLLEKPPTATLGEIEDLACLAEARQVTLFTTWHAQHNPAVAAAAEALAGKRIAAMDILWHEDVRKWHPGQHWIWEPGGFGVFDPGINAFSIATKIFPGTLVRRAAPSFTSRKDAQTPIAAEIEFASPAADGPLTLQPRLAPQRRRGMDHRHPHRRRHRSPARKRRLAAARSTASAQAGEGPGEYPDIYRQFVELIDERRSQVDVAPLRLVADCLLVGRRHIVEARSRLISSTSVTRQA